MPETPWPTIGGSDEPTGVPNLPSPEGAELGRHLARLLDVDPDAEGLCRECAFREGAVGNVRAATVMDALKCAAEGSPVFYCHMQGRGLCPCAGWVAWRRKMLESEGG